MTRRHHIAWLIIGILILPPIAYALAHLAVMAFIPHGEISVFPILLVTALITVGLLIVPYWMLKLLTRAAHKNNPREKELKLTDIPKYQEELDRER